MASQHKVFIDTSVFIRFFTHDDPEKYSDCKDFFRLIESGKLRPYTSNVVILEIVYVLKQLYKFPLTDVITATKGIINIRNMTLIEKTNTPYALEVFEKAFIKYGDSLIASQLPANTKLVTYDKEFTKLKKIATVEPKDFL